MIQSDKFDSSFMDIKKFINTALLFIINRLIEIFGIFISFLGLLLFLALITYSAEDPNFIISDGEEIKNFLGFQGSFTSDIFFQSIGLVSYLVAISFIFTGLNIFLKKEFLLILENTFFTILYSLFGSLFFSHFYNESLTLHVNGNGCFVGNFLNNTFLNKLINTYENIFFYSIITFIIIIFLKSINFNAKAFYISL